MINYQKHLHKKIDNNNNITTKTTTKTTTKQILLTVYVTSSILILAFSIFSIQPSLAQQQQQQLGEHRTNNFSFITNNTTNTNTTSFTEENKKPTHVPNQIVVVAEDIEEIRDNLQEAREALNNANYLQVLSHINNIDKLLTAFVVSGSLTDEINNNLTSSNIATDSTTLAHLSNSSLIKKYNELIEDYNKESKKKKVIN